jgi:diacylglycerol kinase (ATP)
MKKFLKSLRYAITGILTAFEEERNLKVHLVIGFMVVGAGFYFDITETEWYVILLCISMVIGTELINSALENLVDLASKDFHPLAGKAKDIAAGAVLFVSVISLIIGILIFRKYIV